MLFSLLKHYLDIYITDTALEVSRPFYSVTASMPHGVENYFSGLGGTGISDAIFSNVAQKAKVILIWPFKKIQDFMYIV